MIDLRFDHVSKKYRIQQERQRVAGRNSILENCRNLWARPQEFWAVRDVSFEVRRGEALGIIGHNGAGKSTILKLLSSITAPTSGEIEINGRLSALIEVGSGFHQELTGRENIYLNGSILGMRRREITEKLDRILDFAGVRQFIDVPVKRYSSGMYVRLGFSIAAHLDPDILLLDEVLAVGDAAFQAKCLQRIEDLKRAGTTIVFISHDLSAVERLCDRVLLLNRGEIIADGFPFDVITRYQRISANYLPAISLEAVAGNESRGAEITSVTFYDFEGRETRAFRTGEPFKVCIECVAQGWIQDAVFEALFDIGNGPHCHFTTELSDERIDLRPGTGVIEFYCAELGLRPGGYKVDIRVKHRGVLDYIDWKSTFINVGQGKLTVGAFYMPHQWRFMQGETNNERTGSLVSGASVASE